MILTLLFYVSLVAKSLLFTMPIKIKQPGDCHSSIRKPLIQSVRVLGTTQHFSHEFWNSVYPDLRCKPWTGRKKMFPTCLLVCLRLDTNGDVTAIS